MTTHSSPIALTPAAFKSAIRPVWCPGCGHFGALEALRNALAASGRPSEEVAIVSGGGCAARLPVYLAPWSIQAAHGRALAFATGLKTVRPELNVVVVAGDGDAYAIGGNHFLHACRRDVDMLYVVLDNHVFGESRALPVLGTEQRALDLPKLEDRGSAFNPLAIAIAAGARDPSSLSQLMLEGIRWPGFAMLEVLSPCVTFRPGQRTWSEATYRRLEHPAEDASLAMRALLEDDGYGVGVFYRRNAMPRSVLPHAIQTLAEIEAQFIVTPDAAADISS
jgi:2-oxoglutarate/2-oxoacid ferredoxin oxidoreductase subunit beta